MMQIQRMGTECRLIFIEISAWNSFWVQQNDLCVETQEENGKLRYSSFAFPMKFERWSVVGEIHNNIEQGRRCLRKHLYKSSRELFISLSNVNEI